jgi:hypothetical protein
MWAVGVGWHANRFSRYRNDHAHPLRTSYRFCCSYGSALFASRCAKRRPVAIYSNGLPLRLCRRIHQGQRLLVLQARLGVIPMAKQKNTMRNGTAVAAMHRNSAGPMRHRLAPRGNARSKANADAVVEYEASFEKCCDAWED